MPGPLMHGIVRLRTAAALRRQGYSFSDARHLAESVSGELIDAAVHQVATAKGVEAPDGSILQKLLDFINAHWEDILKIILALLGI